MLIVYNEYDIIIQYSVVMPTPEASGAAGSLIYGGFTMKKLILITGDLAAGKSTYSKILSERYNMNVINKDPLKEILCDTIGFDGREQNLKLSVAATSVMCYLFSEFAKFGRDIILEANFHAQELVRLNETAKENGYSVLTLVFRGDIAVLHERYMNRIRCEHRHPGHLSIALDELEDFRQYIEIARLDEIPGETIEVNADDFAYKTDETLFRKIDDFLGR